jgi:hypothetical protein
VNNTLTLETERTIILSNREKVLKMEKIISNLPDARFGDTEYAPLKHSFAKGCYIREMFMPKGTLASGKIHKNDHPMFVLKGRLGLYTAEEGLQMIEGPCHFISRAGTKRIGYAYEDAVLVEVHITNETDLKKIENEVIVKSFEDFDKIFLKEE